MSTNTRSGAARTHDGGNARELWDGFRVEATRLTLNHPARFCNPSEPWALARAEPRIRGCRTVAHGYLLILA